MDVDESMWVRLGYGWMDGWMDVDGCGWMWMDGWMWMNLCGLG